LGIGLGLGLGLGLETKGIEKRKRNDNWALGLENE